MASWMSWWFADEKAKGLNPPDREPQPLDADAALRRLVYVALIGCAFIVGYGSHYFRHGFRGIATVGLMAGGAALLTGGLLGFLFGVPHTRQPESGTKGVPTPKDPPNPTDGVERQGERADQTLSPYRPNTSLEQVSDWLTKIIVGVGLVEFRTILEKFTALAKYLANGLGDPKQAEAFAATLVVYFAVVGFVFGFLWARLYLPRWFSDADDVQRLRQKVSRLEADANAFALTIQQLNPASLESTASDQDIAKAIKAASPGMRQQIFEKAKDYALNRRSDVDYQDKIDSVISILQGLIGAEEKSHPHTRHAELSYAFIRKAPADWDEAIDQISRAIAIRDTLRKTGWKYYEFHRARCLIEKRDPALVDRILTDLRAASIEPETFEKFLKDVTVVDRWLKDNNIDRGTLTRSGDIGGQNK